ncbi:MAG: response regulator receiver protein [Micrococcaceae bacterium]|nr:response regulator receiver protein [Micrococcaceae bacterium]
MAHPPIPKPSTLVVNHLQDRVLETNDIRELLDGLATFTAGTLIDPAIACCSITLTGDQDPVTAGSSDQRSARLDKGQYEAGDGPCLAAIREQITIHVPDVSNEHCWPDYTTAARKEGVRSSVSVPLLLEGHTAAGLNLYSTIAHGFSVVDIDMIQEYAFRASKALRLAVRISYLTDANDQLAADLESPNITDLAIGAVMAQNHCDQPAAVKILTIAASTRGMEAGDIASSVLASLPEGTTRPVLTNEVLNTFGLPSIDRSGTS